MGSPTPSSDQTNLGMAPNLAGLLCYAPCCIGLIFSIVAAIVEKRSRSVRFQAFQSLLLHGVALVVSVALLVLQTAVGMLLGPLAFLVGLLGMAVGLAFLALVVFLMVKAYNNEEFLLPVIGEMARNWA